MSKWLIDWFLRILYQLLWYIPRRQQNTFVTYLLNPSGTMSRKTHFICTRKLHSSNTGFVLSLFLFYQSFHINTNIFLPLVSRSKFYIISQIIKIKTTAFLDFSCSLVNKHDISEEPFAFAFILQFQSDTEGRRFPRNALAYLSQQRML